MGKDDTGCIAPRQYASYQRRAAEAATLRIMDAHERLKHWRESLNYPSAAAFAQAHEGVTESTYRSHENGIRRITEVVAKRYAALMGSPERWWWLYSGEESGALPAEAVLEGVVGAGQQIVPMDGRDDAAKDTVIAPPGLSKPAAVVVRGESMWPVYRDGDVIFYARSERWSERACINRDCVVQVKDGPRFIKTLAKGTAANFFTLRSYQSPDIENVAVEWAAPVEWVRRR